MRRQSWLQEQQAVHVLNAYIKAMSGGKNTQGAGPEGFPPVSNGASAPPSGKRVSGGDLLNMMRSRTG